MRYAMLICGVEDEWTGMREDETRAAMEQIGEKGILILYAAETRNYANDVQWPFRQENDFFYLTGLTQPGATLVIAPGAGKMREMVLAMDTADAARAVCPTG